MSNSQQPFIVIRNYCDDDELKCQELIRDYIMSFAKKAFFCFCFREITLQFIVITWAILFIFIGVPLSFCALTVPGCLSVLFSAIYFSFYAKAVELMGDKPQQGIVAECYEPYITLLKPKEASYELFTERAPYDDDYQRKFRRKIVAMISVKNHNSVYNGALIHRFAVAPDYPFRKIVEPMMKLISENCSNHGYATLEAILSEWQEQERDFYDSLGYETRQIYHKKIIGSTVTVLKTSLCFNLLSDESLLKRN